MADDFREHLKGRIPQRWQWYRPSFAGSTDGVWVVTYWWDGKLDFECTISSDEAIWLSSLPERLAEAAE
jgi:hypothetical protein